MKPATAKFFTATVLTVCMALSGCGTATPEVDHHTMSSLRLVDLMRRMEILVHERELPAEQIIQMRGNQAHALEAIAIEIAVRAPELRPELPPDRVDQFAASADKLRDAAGDLNAAARAGDPRHLQSALRRLQDACDACHAGFRDQVAR